VYELIRSAAAAGMAVLVVSSHVEDCVDASDRIVVIKDGAVVGELEGSERTQATAIALATGEAG
jgi:ABC-type sugar transport system ATPase subunit